MSTVETQRRTSIGVEVAFRRHNKCGDLRPNSVTLSSSRAVRRPGFRPVADRFELSTCRDNSNLVADWFAAGLRPAHGLVRELLASWIAPDRPNSITLSSSLAGRRPAREPAGELDSVMEFGLYFLSCCDVVVFYYCEYVD